MIQVNRAYLPANKDAGTRLLVERLWPRGVKKETLQAEAWLKDVAPSNELRQWFQHDPAKWDEFRQRYFHELASKPDAWQPLLARGAAGPSNAGVQRTRHGHNNAVALKEFLIQKLRVKKAAQLIQHGAAARQIWRRSRLVHRWRGFISLHVSCL